MRCFKFVFLTLFVLSFGAFNVYSLAPKHCQVNANDLVSDLLGKWFAPAENSVSSLLEGLESGNNQLKEEVLGNGLRLFTFTDKDGAFQGKMIAHQNRIYLFDGFTKTFVRTSFSSEAFFNRSKKFREKRTLNRKVSVYFSINPDTLDDKTMRRLPARTRTLVKHFQEIDGISSLDHHAIQLSDDMDERDESSRMFGVYFQLTEMGFYDPKLKVGIRVGTVIHESTHHVFQQFKNAYHKSGKRSPAENEWADKYSRIVDHFRNHNFALLQSIVDHRDESYGKDYVCKIKLNVEDPKLFEDLTNEALAFCMEAIVMDVPLFNNRGLPNRITQKDINFLMELGMLPEKTGYSFTATESPPVLAPEKQTELMNEATIRLRVKMLTEKNLTLERLSDIEAELLSIHEILRPIPLKDMLRKLGLNKKFSFQPKDWKRLLLNFFENILPWNSSYPESLQRQLSPQNRITSGSA